MTASAGVNVPSRLARQSTAASAARLRAPRTESASPAVRLANELALSKTATTATRSCQLDELQAMVEELCQHARPRPASGLARGALPPVHRPDRSRRERRDWPASWSSGSGHEHATSELADSVLLKARVARMIEDEIRVAGPIRDARRASGGWWRWSGRPGVGKTTTIAKLAANYRLQEKRRVGLITVDTYRIAAVEQLRTYADIIDLPMEVVSTPREMRAGGRPHGRPRPGPDGHGRPQPARRSQDPGTASRCWPRPSPTKCTWCSAAWPARESLAKTAERFAAVGTTALMLTKLDEATGLGNLLPLLRSSRLPLSYLTNGQNVPDDIETADANAWRG